MKNREKKAFTLVEALLYSAVLGICLIALSGFMDMISAAKVKNKSILEVERQGRNISSILQKSIISSNGINYPIPGNTNNSISLTMSDPSKNPTIFTINSTSLFIQEGNNPAIAISGPNITAKDLMFENLSRPGTPGNIYVSFTLSSGENKRQEFFYNRNFSLSVSRR